VLKHSDLETKKLQLENCPRFYFRFAQRACKNHQRLKNAKNKRSPKKCQKSTLKTAVIQPILKIQTLQNSIGWLGKKWAKYKNLSP